MFTSKQTKQRVKTKISEQTSELLVSSVNEPTRDRLQVMLFHCLLTVNRPNFMCDSGDDGSLLKETEKEKDESSNKILHPLTYSRTFQSHLPLHSIVVIVVELYSVLLTDTASSDLCHLANQVESVPLFPL